MCKKVNIHIIYLSCFEVSPRVSVKYFPRAVQLVTSAFPFVSTATRTPRSFVRKSRQGMTSSYKWGATRLRCAMKCYEIINQEKWMNLMNSKVVFICMQNQRKWQDCFIQFFLNNNEARNWFVQRRRRLWVINIERRLRVVSCKMWEE